MKITFRKAVALKAAKEAGLFIKKRLGRVQKVSYKGEINLVTDVDKKAESLILDKIKINFPQDSILSEEAGMEKRSGAFLWIIDPLDGTTNFFRSFPFFCVSIAVAYDGEVVFGAIYDPLRSELFYAQEGQGAFLNSKRIRVSETKTLSNAFLATGFSYQVRCNANTNIRNFSKFLKQSFAIRRAGSAALDLAYVACGRFDGFWELDLRPWDSAAGSLIVEEAGGKVTRFDGSPNTYFAKDILATNSLIHPAMSNLLAKV